MTFIVAHVAVLIVASVWSFPNDFSADLVVHGMVKDESGGAIDGATVSAARARSAVITDSNGYYRLSFDPQQVTVGGFVRVTVVKPGFSPQNRDLAITLPAKYEDFRLGRSGVSGGGPPARKRGSIGESSSANDNPANTIPRIFEIAIRYQDPVDRDLVSRLAEYIDAHDQLKVRSVELVPERGSTRLSAEIAYFKWPGPADMLKTIVQDRLALLGRSQTVRIVPGDPSRQSQAISLDLLVPKAVTAAIDHQIDDASRQQNAKIKVAVFPDSRAVGRKDPCIDAAMGTLKLAGFQVEEFLTGYTYRESDSSLRRFNPYSFPGTNGVYFYYKDYEAKAKEILDLLATWIDKDRVWFLPPARVPGEASLHLSKFMEQNPIIRIQVNICR